MAALINRSLLSGLFTDNGVSAVVDISGLDREQFVLYLYATDFDSGTVVLQTSSDGVNFSPFITHAGTPISSGTSKAFSFKMLAHYVRLEVTGIAAASADITYNLMH